MAIDKQDGTGITPKQKIMGGLLVAVLLIVIWQIWGLFGSSSEESAPIQSAPPGKMAANGKPATAQMQPTTAAPANTANNNPAMNPQLNPQPTITAAPLKEPPTSTREQQQQQKDFLDSVNELQMLKLQRDIAETNQAIAAAKLATEATKKSINDLLQTKPAPAPVPAANYSNSLVNPSLPQGLTAIPTANNGPSAPPPAVTADADPGLSPYVVISVSMQRNRWTAVLGNAGKLYSVSIGDVLPLDGWVVSSITREGVTMKKNGQTRKVSLVPVI